MHSIFAVLALSVAATSVDGQTAPDSGDPRPTTQSAVDALKVIDQLVQQNKDLEQQNEKLMEQIDVLRKALGVQNPAAPAPASKPAETAATEQAREAETSVGKLTEAVSDDEALEAAGEQAAQRKGKSSETCCTERGEDLGRVFTRYWVPSGKHEVWRSANQHHDIHSLLEPARSGPDLHKFIWHDVKCLATPGFPTEQDADQVSGLDAEPEVPLLPLCLDPKRFNGLHHTRFGTGCGGRIH